MPVSVHRFGDFELDPSRFELRCKGQVVRLERIPMELLILLIEKDGTVASRQEIIERLWGKDVFVDTEHGINTAIRKIRTALQEEADHPRFVQTVTGKGYRFAVEPKDGSLRVVEPDNGAESGDGNSPGRPQPPGPTPEVSSPEPPVQVIPANPRQYWPALLAAITLCLIAFALGFNVKGIRNRVFPGGRAAQIHSIAVIPLANLSGDPSQDYFADGMTDEVITMLAKNTSLRVVSRTSAMQYKGVNRPLGDIAKELGVDGILEGSIARSPNHVHMTMQLIYAPTDSHVWAESYDRDLAQAISIPAELSETIAKEVKIATSPARPAPYINPEAHDAYLRGRYFWLNFDTKQSLAFFQKAIDLQPDYAAAWSGVADSYSFATFNTDTPPQPAMAKALAAAHKAVELDDSLPEAHCSMAGTAFLSWDIALADTEIRRALELNPNYSEAHYLHYQILLVENRRDEALQEAKRATQLDLFSRPWGLGDAFINVRQWDTALNEFQLQVQARPSDATIHFNLSQIYWFKGMYKESEQELEKGDQLSGQPEEAAAHHRAFARGGEKAVARYSADQIKARARKTYVSPLDIAHSVAYTGNKDETLKYLEDAYQEHTPSLEWVQTYPEYDFLHSDPRYQALVKKMGLTPAN